MNGVSLHILYKDGGSGYIRHIASEVSSEVELVSMDDTEWVLYKMEWANRKYQGRS